MMPILLMLLALPTLVLPPAARAQAAADDDQEARGGPYMVPRVEGIVLDGFVDEAEWEASAPLDGVGHLPVFGIEPSERTEFRLAHDGENLYFACLSYDSEPHLVRALSLRRHETGFVSDRCAILIDSANDEENALGFYTSPAGVRNDYAYSNDGGVVNPDWNTFWDVAVTQDERGWFAEFRIPFSSLLFQAEDDRVTMGVSMLRNIARKNERVLYPAISPEWGRAHGKSSLMRKIALDGVRRADPVYVTPYALLGSGYGHTISEAADAYDREPSRVRDVGFDARYGITSNLTLDLTVNTDFAQVEADEQQVNLTRFSLFFPEKRRFFQERSANFEYSLGGDERLFHSRRMGLGSGEPVRIYGGARLVGRLGDWDVGLLDLQTARSELLPGENQGVLRIRRRVLNDNSYVGGILTSRWGTDGGRNLVLGLDGIVRVAGADYLTINVAQSFDAGAGAPPGGADLDGALLRLNWERRGQDGFTHALDLSRVGATFEPGLGFLRRRDYMKASAAARYGWRPGTDSPLLRYAIGVEGAVFRRNADRTVETAEVEPSVVVDLKSGHGITFAAPIRYENLTEAFALPDGVQVPAGIHRFAESRLEYSPPGGATFKPTFTVAVGRFFDGRQVSASFRPTWNPSRHLTVDGAYRVDRVEFPDREQSLTAQLVSLRTELMFSTAVSVSTFVQYNSTGNALVSNLRFRFNPREGNDLYVVWNEGLATDRFALDPVPPRSTHRSLMLKYAHTLRLDL